MTEATEVEVTQAEYVIRKGRYYYRPNAQGYTSNVGEAGRFSLEDAIRHSFPNGPEGPRDGIDYVPAPARALTQAGASLTAAQKAGPVLLEALRMISYSIKQANIPGNDWKRELRLIENLALAAIAQAQDPE